jgi:hypothetical protein
MLVVAVVGLQVALLETTLLVVQEIRLQQVRHKETMAVQDLAQQHNHNAQAAAVAVPVRLEAMPQTIMVAMVALDLMPTAHGPRQLQQVSADFMLAAVAVLAPVLTAQQQMVAAQTQQQRLQTRAAVAVEVQTHRIIQAHQAL